LPQEYYYLAEADLAEIGAGKNIAGALERKQTKNREINKSEEILIQEKISKQDFWLRYNDTLILHPD